MLKRNGGDIMARSKKYIIKLTDDEVKKEIRNPKERYFQNHPEPLSDYSGYG